MQNRTTVMKALEMLSGAFPNWKASEVTLSIYLQELEDLPAERVVVAIRHLIRTSKSDFAPSIGTIRDTIDPIGSATERVGGMWTSAKAMGLLGQRAASKIGEGVRNDRIAGNRQDE